MTQIGDFNPFNPGSGESPPYLAGRESEQGRLRKILAEISAGRSPAAETVMYGPRGMGKTVLLNWLEDEVEKGGAKNNSIRVSRVTPDQLTSPAEMWDFLISKNWLQKKFPNKKEVGVKGFLYGAWTENSTSPKELLDKLIHQCKKSPLVCLLDEAHTMDAGLCNGLLNLSQAVRNEAPFLLVLAGTPGLRHFLSTVNASFVERSNVIGIARLDAQATADAIVKPLNEHGIEIDDNTLAQVVEDSQHYPYFIQLWGAALWDLAKEKDLQKLTSQEITEAETKVGNRRLNFYEQRRKTLSDIGLLPAAVAIAAVFQDTETTTRDYLKEIIADNLPDDSLATQSVNEHLQTFIRHEFIWNPPDTNLYEAGIPSLMRYVLDRQR
ncbi:AAA family ATPase [Candidatus Spongiihabitans sp.]|uniref:ATP-binding protein n=1 Tax=Candidatus Spongiihabitans sp. TaxID=3101308 RepID=UPI003C7B4EEA